MSDKSKKGVVLKPCPFCGFGTTNGILVDTRAKLICDPTDNFVLICPKCMAKGPHAKDMMGAIAAWNRRKK